MTDCPINDTSFAWRNIIDVIFVLKWCSSLTFYFSHLKTFRFGCARHFFTRFIVFWSWTFYNKKQHCSPNLRMFLHVQYPVQLSWQRRMTLLVLILQNASLWLRARPTPFDTHTHTRAALGHSGARARKSPWARLESCQETFK